MKTISPDIQYPRVVSRPEWLQARLKLLAREKAMTKARDRLNTERRELPMVRVEQDYVFAGPAGPVRLADLFGGHHQLVIFHFMWRWVNGQPLDEPCKGCSGWADQLARGHFSTLHSRHTSLAVVTRGPRSKLEAFQARMGWNFPMYSSFDTRFNHDFGVTVDATVTPPAYNYRTREEHQRAGTGYYFEGGEPGDLPGMSCFLRQGEEVFHTYSTYGRGTEQSGGTTQLLDMTALGRQEEWEEPKGRAGSLTTPAGPPPLYPDQYKA
jgi:predicted dithiol-disulfide oxidoreductase (DUF899 family)